MYESPQKRQDPRLFGLSGTFLNGAFLLIVAAVIAGGSAWLIAFGGVDSVGSSLEQVKSEVTLLIDGRDVPAAAVDAPETWVTLDPNEGARQAIVAEMRATNPELARDIERAFSYFGGLEMLYVAFDPASPPGFSTNVNILGQRYDSSTTLEKEIALIEQQLPVQGITINSITRDLTIGGYPAARVTMRFNTAGVEVVGVQYAVLAEETLAYAITFVTTSDRIDALAPLFEQTAATFRVLED
jgi:hypothetical protein